MLNFDSSVAKENLAVNYFEEPEFLKISLDRKFKADEEILLQISYNGGLRDDGKGVFRSSYLDEQNQTVWYAATNFEPTFARFTMPCYDEPGFHAVIGLHTKYRHLVPIAIVFSTHLWTVPIPEDPSTPQATCGS